MLVPTINDKFGSTPIHRIVVLRALQLGDLLCAIPAWRALRAYFPLAHITLIGLSWARGFVVRFHRYFDEFLEFPGYPGLPERGFVAAEILPFLSHLQNRRFDLALQMHGNGTCTNSLIALFGARLAAGFYVPGGFCPHPRLFTPYPDGISEVQRHLQLMGFLGIPPLGNDLEFPLTAEDDTRFSAAIALKPQSYACVHPGGRGMKRRWPVEGFAQIADGIAERGLRVVITGTAEERELALGMECRMRSSPINLVGRTDLGTLGVLLRGARVLISNDTGVVHLAAALRLPSVVLSVGSDPLRWAPLDGRRHRVQLGAAASGASVLREVDDLLASDARSA